MLKLLYIDDDIDSLELYQGLLSPYFQVETFIDPQEGLRVAKEGHFDAIMLDIYLPGITGFQLYEEIRKYPRTKRTPIFFISSENNTGNRLKAFGLGSEDFISRDMDPNEVIARIHNRIKKMISSGTLVLGDIKVDQENLLVYCDNELLELTQTEYRLLILLLRESIDTPGKVLDRQNIIEFVWPLDHEKVYPRTLSTHLTNLRKKLSSKSVNFVSIRQEGFCLEVK